MRQRLDVDAAGGDVGGDEDGDRPGLEAGQGLRPLRLAAVAVDAAGVDAVAHEVVGQAVRAVLGAREGDHAA